MDGQMTFREMNLKVFRGEPIDRVFHQPRIEPWFARHKRLGTLPEEISHINTPLELYHHLGLSMRYVHYHTGLPGPFERNYSEKVKTRRKMDGDIIIDIIETPHGELVKKGKEGIYSNIEFPVKDRNDLPKMAWLLENTTCSFNGDAFLKSSAEFGDVGLPSFWGPKSPFQSMGMEWMGFQNFFYLLADAPDEARDMMKRIGEWSDQFFEEMCGAGTVELYNFGENLHAQYLPPEYIEEFLMPYYHKRHAQLKNAGIFTTVHLDGYFKPMLPVIKDFPFDGIEALTPLPQGDATVEEMAEHIGDKILLDGIAAMLFMPEHTDEELEEQVKKVVKLFYPRLVLGISDELPQGTDETGLRRLKWVEKYCGDYKG